MSAPCIGPCGRDCNANQGHARCNHCPGRPFELPAALRPLSDRQIVVGILICIALLGLAGCGGGRADDPEQRKDDPSPNCAMRPELCS